jgi:hypothetical protein
MAAMTERRDDDWAGQHYEPLPGLLGLPAFAWRRLGRRGRALVLIAVGLALAGTAIAVPLIVSGKDEGAQERSRERAVVLAREVARLRADQAPRRGRAPAATAQAALLGRLEQAITADARERQRHGLLPPPPVRRTVCQARAPELAPLESSARRAGGQVLKCLAATTVSAAPGGQRSAIGFEFVAAVNHRRRTFTWCKTNPPPAIGGAGLPEVPLSRACFDPAR